MVLGIGNAVSDILAGPDQQILYSQYSKFAPKRFYSRDSIFQLHYGMEQGNYFWHVGPVWFMGIRYFFSAFVIAASLFIWMIRARKIWVIMSLGAIVGGALGNILDRLRFGAVVDFIHFHVAGWSWYVFNVADSAIVCGVIILLMDAFFGWEE